MAESKTSVIFNIKEENHPDPDNLNAEITTVVTEEFIETIDTDDSCLDNTTKFAKSKRKKNSENVEDPKRSFRKKWLFKPELRPWLASAPEAPNYVKCKWCNVYLRAHLHDLKKHNTSNKHRKQSVKYSFSNVSTNILVQTEECESQLNHEKKPLKECKEDSLTEHSRENLTPARVGFIGCGTVAQALIKGFIKSGSIDPSCIMVSAPSNKYLRILQPLKVKCTHNNVVILEQSDIVFLCLNQHAIPEVLASLSPLNKDIKSPLFVSIVSGLTIAQLEDMFGEVLPAPRIVRAFPNILCTVSEGCCVFTRGSNVESSEGDVLKCLLGSLGLCEEVLEAHLDASCGLATSGPVSVYAVIESLTNGAVKMGLPRVLAMALAAQTVKGAASMVLETGKHPAQLKDEACSPGGPTIAALHTLEKGGLRGLLMSTVEVATEKSKEAA